MDSAQVLEDVVLNDEVYSRYVVGIWVDWLLSDVVL